MNTSASNGVANGRWRYEWLHLRWWLRKNAVMTILTILLIVLLLVLFWPTYAVTIGPGEAGVLWRRFDDGTVTVADDGKPFIGRIQANYSGEATSVIEHIEDKEKQVSKKGYHVYPFLEGTHYIWPWNEMFIYNVRLQQVTHNFDVLTSDGLEVQAQIAITWKPIEADLGKLHRDIGPNYINVLLIPTVGACAREEIAKYLPDALYSPKRLEMQEGIRDCVKETMLSRFYPLDKRESYLMVEDVLIRDVILPEQVKQAIADKVAQKHLADSYQYRLARERMEADRKAIEADGIRRFQQTVNSTISEGYLKWKGIDATLELARSANAKVVVIGSGKDGLPIILGGLDNPAGAAAQQSGVAAGPAPAPAAGTASHVSPPPPSLSITAAESGMPGSLQPLAARQPEPATPPPTTVVGHHGG